MTKQTAWATYRTGIQVIAGLVTAIPIAAVAAGVDAAIAATVTGIMSACVILATAVQNAIETKVGKQIGGSSPNAVAAANPDMKEPEKP